MKFFKNFSTKISGDNFGDLNPENFQYNLVEFFQGFPVVSVVETTVIFFKGIFKGIPETFLTDSQDQFQSGTFVGIHAEIYARIPEGILAGIFAGVLKKEIS